MALVVLDAGLVNVALPVMAASLRVTPAQAILTVSAYQTALVIGLLPSAHVAEKFGYKRMFLAGVNLFSAASILCGFAPTLGVLVAARMLQGLGGAAIMALGIALLRVALGNEQIGRAIGWNALNVAMCSAAGPIVGALILSIAPWPWLFFTKLPLIVVALTTSVALPEVASSRSRIDHAGITLHASIAGLFLAAAGIAQSGWAALAASLAVGLAVLLIRRERAREAPIWPIDLLGQRAFRVSVMASVCCFIAQSAGMLAFPLYLQLALGYGPFGASIVMICWPLTVATTSSVANCLAEQLGSARLCIAGGSLLGLGLLFSALWPVGQSIIPLAIGAALSGLGFGLFQVPNNRTMFLSAPPDRSAAAGGMQGTARLIGQTTGALAIGLLLTGASAAAAPRLGLALGAIFGVIAALVSAMGIAEHHERPAQPRG
ncbi:MFS transporter [Novosphingobium endophyticum]|uniref:MFS transporter n=2 Tax=Novosphingobium endophyticum TaxID=1955250 RepID=A0A916TU39_9SPHN|nr:MFS transporter [Novosphingobium endophyticum]